MCGIWGIINTEYAPFDYKTFCVLGVANDKRGGDSCGIFIDGNVEYGITKTALFEAFYPGSKLLRQTKRCKIAIGHDRKASSGGVSLEKAQPVIIKENEETKFVLIHNGTIYNYEELAKKYIPNTNVFGMSDSQVLAQILYHTGYDVLKEYQGGAAFVAVDYRSGRPRVFLYRGESKKYSTSAAAEEERPLFLNYKNGRLVFSSVHSYIPILDGGRYYILPANEIIEYRDSKLYMIKEIDRSKATQARCAVTSYGYGYGYGYNYGVPSENRYWDDDEVATPNQSVGTGYTQGSAYVRHLPGKNIFEYNARPMSGGYRMTGYGRVVTDPKEKNSEYVTIREVWFYHGIPMKSKNAWDFVTRMFTESPNSWEPFFSKNENFIRYLSADPVYFEDNHLLHAIEPFKWENFTGDRQVLFQASIDIYANGQFVRRKTGVIGGDASKQFDALFNVEDNTDYDALWQVYLQSIA